MERRKEKLKLEILTPTYIGGSENKNLSNKDYFLDGNFINVIDTAKLMKYLTDNNLYDKFIVGVESNKHIVDILDQIDAKDYEDKIIKEKIDVGTIVYKQGKRNLNNINMFVKGVDGKPYIPASTIKGVITNAITYNYIINNKYKFNNIREDIKEGLKENWMLKKQWKKIESIIFKEEVEERKTNIDLRSFINVSDAFALNDVYTFITAKEDFSVTDKTSKIVKLPIYREYLIPNSVFEFDINIDFEKVKKLNISSVKDVLDMLEIYTNKCIEIERKLEKVAEQKGITAFRTVNEKLPNVILGGGSGYYSKSLLSALFENDKELVDIVKNTLKRGNHKVLDVVSSPRTIKLSKYNSNYYFVGMARIEEEKC